MQFFSVRHHVSTNFAKITPKIDSVFHQPIKSKMTEEVIHFHKNLKIL